MAKASMPPQAIAIAIGLSLLFGGNQVASRVALSAFSPMLCGCLAFTLAAIIILGYAQQQHVSLCPPSRQIVCLHGLSAVLFLAFNAVALIGLQFTLASRASIFIAVHPFFVILIHRFLSKQPAMTMGQWVGLGLALMGVLIVFRDRLSLTWYGYGDTLLLLAAFLLGLLIVHIRRVTRQVSVVQATFWQISLSLPLFGTGAWLFESPISLPRLSAPWWSLVYMGLAVNAIAFVVRAELFRRYDANIVASFLFIAPVIGVLLGHTLLDEPLSREVELGSLVLAIGVFWIYRYGSNQHSSA